MTTTTMVLFPCSPSFLLYVILLLSCGSLFSSQNDIRVAAKITEQQETANADESLFASARFKAPNDSTPQSLLEEWKQQDSQLWDYVNKHVPAVLNHTGTAAFDEHLKGVQAVLRYWGSPEYLANAGLFHSIYGTEGFQGFKLPLSQRPDIIKLIGEPSERLCWIFCMVDRRSVDKHVFEYSPETFRKKSEFVLTSRPELGRFHMTLDKTEFLDFIELSLGDWLEQVEGAALKPNPAFLWKVGEAYCYRREAYRKMTEILSMERAPRLATVCKEMYDAVFATESNATRHLHQAQTPAMSEAAEEAFRALRSAGEEIPEYLGPISMNQEGKEGGVNLKEEL